jgi:alanine racemase
MTREGLELCIKHDVDVCIDNTIWQEKLKGLEIPSNKKLNVHIFIDTGLSREGFIFENIEMINFVNEFKEKISIKGFLSHLADGEDEDLTETQYECFHSCYKELIKVLGLSARDMIVQISASAGLLNKPYIDSTHFRVGLSIYGHYPSENSKKVFTEKFKRQLKPVLSLKSPSQLIKLLPKNRKVSYSGTYICKNDTKIALFPIGYFDGYPRLLSQKSHVLINDALCPILGNIAMNHIIVDISMLERHDSELTATLIGKSAFHEIKVEELAKHTRTINYEILARLGEHLERRII